MNQQRERLAEYAHTAWSGWMRYLFEKSTANPDGTVTIPAWAVERWQRQMQTAYADLPESEKASDRAEADAMLAILAPLYQALEAARHELTTLHGLWAYDGAAPQEPWQLDERSTLARLDAVLAIE
jgi:hypothetical protein